MSDRAQRVLDALMKYDDIADETYPITVINEFFNNLISIAISEDYELLTADEEKQVIQAFLESAY